MFDLVICNGRVIDPASHLDAPRDVAMTGGRIAVLIDPGTAADVQRTIDVGGRYVVPGLIDFHVHVFPGVSHFGVEVDSTCLARGVTTVVDFGTAGGLIIDGFRRFVIDEVQTRVFALLHIAGQGLISSDIHHYNVHGPVFDLATTMDKFLHLGLSLSEVIRLTTQNPARFLGRETELGTLQPGSAADITVLDVTEGEFPLADSEGRIEIGRRRLVPTHVIRSGRQAGMLPRPDAR